MRPFAAAALLAVIPQPAAAQHPAHVAVHVGAPLYAEADPTSGARSRGASTSGGAGA